MADAETHNDGPEDGARLLDDVYAAVTRYSVFPNEHAAVATTLWIATTHTLPAFDCAPRLAMNSPQKRCGKTRTLDIIAATCHLALATSDATIAAIFRSLGGDHPPTLIVDEADTKFGTKKVAEQNEDLRALINAGHQKGKPVLRCVGPTHVPVEFDVFAMVALAGIGSLPDTITDRAINITMRRRAPGETVSQFRRRRDGPILDALRVRLAAWAAPLLEALSMATPEMPVEDRAADTWEPLVATADAAGGDWPEKARAACKAMVAVAEEEDGDQSVGIKLLADIHEVFTNHFHGTPFLASATLVDKLRQLDESPWDEFKMTTRNLAWRLKGFGVRPDRNQTNTTRGYYLTAFDDAFERYIRPTRPDRPETGHDQG